MQSERVRCSLMASCWTFVMLHMIRPQLCRLAATITLWWHPSSKLDGALLYISLPAHWNMVQHLLIVLINEAKHCFKACTFLALQNVYWTPLALRTARHMIPLYSYVLLRYVQYGSCSWLSQCLVECQLLKYRTLFPIIDRCIVCSVSNHICHVQAYVLLQEWLIMQWIHRIRRRLRKNL